MRKMLIVCVCLLLVSCQALKEKVCEESLVNLHYGC